MTKFYKKGKQYFFVAPESRGKTGFKPWSGPKVGKSYESKFNLLLVLFKGVVLTKNVKQMKNRVPDAPGGREPAGSTRKN